MSAPPRIFTPREASQTLPLVRRIAEDILDAGKRVRERAVAAGARPEEDPEVVSGIESLEALIEELESIGCSYRDWNFTMGLVDFPAVIGGEEVLLCWRSDEPELLYYHDVESGFAGRRPIPRELLEN